MSSPYDFCQFYSAYYAERCVTATTILYICLSVRTNNTRRYCVKTNEHRMILSYWQIAHWL